MTYRTMRKLSDLGRAVLRCTLLALLVLSVAGVATIEETGAVAVYAVTALLSVLALFALHKHPERFTPEELSFLDD